MRGNSGIIGAKQNTSTSSASGMFDIVDQQLAVGSSQWPLGTGQFTITPSVNNLTLWDLSTNDLNLTANNEYTITCLEDFTAVAQLWGAGGARGYVYFGPSTSTNNQGPGGGGGHSNAVINFVSGQSFKFRVGQGGARSTVASLGATYLAGGVQTTTDKGGTQGGGYTGIFKDTVTQANTYLLAGGGGGGGDSSYSGGGQGGAGGGSSGGNTGDSGGQGGGGGTQLAGGTQSQYGGATAGSALRGGIGGGSNGGIASLGGGGGGYYGGGGGHAGGAGGGSGFFNSNTTILIGRTIAGNGNTAAVHTAANGAGQGGSASQGNTGADGRILLQKVKTASLSLDGTGDYISLPSSTTLDLDGNFTIECWIYLTATAADYQMLLGNSISNTGAYLSIGSTKIYFQFGATGLTQAEITYTTPTNTWIHLTCVRNSGTVSIYVDGVSKTVTNNSQAGTFSPRYVGVGYSSSYTFPGYISNLRILKGIALYTSNFTPSQTNLKAISNTSLLLASNQLAGMDWSTNKHDLTFNGNATYTTSIVPF